MQPLLAVIGHQHIDLRTMNNHRTGITKKLTDGIIHGR